MKLVDGRILEYFDQSNDASQKTDLCYKLRLDGKTNLTDGLNGALIGSIRSSVLIL